MGQSTWDREQVEVLVLTSPSQGAEQLWGTWLPPGQWVPSRSGFTGLG